MVPQERPVIDTQAEDSSSPQKKEEEATPEKEDPEVSDQDEDKLTGCHIGFRQLSHIKAMVPPLPQRID